MATAEETGIRMERTGESIAGRHDETKWALLTTEFWAMLGLNPPRGALREVAARAATHAGNGRASGDPRAGQ